MTEVLEFPTREAQAFAYLERELTALLTARGADDALIAHGLGALKSVYLEASEASDFAFSIDLPAPMASEQVALLQQQIAEGVEAMRDHHHSLVLKLAARLLLTELKLFQHEREGAS